MIAIVILFVAMFSTKTQAEVIGTITTLPPTTMKDLCMWPAVDAVSSCIIDTDRELHTWTQWSLGSYVFKLKLEWSVAGGDNFILTLFCENVILDKAQANRIDGELTQSVTVKSKGNKQIVTWLMTNKICKQRTYYTRKVHGEWVVEAKEEIDCKYPTSVLSWENVSKSFVSRKNYWSWGEKPLSAWNFNVGMKSGYWGGSVIKLPTESGMASVFCQSKNLIHTWNHIMAKNYKLLLYRNLDEGKVRFFIEIRYMDMVLDSGIEVTRFDDDMLTSVTVMEDQTLRDNSPITQTDNFEVAYKTTSGQCYARVYKMEIGTKGEPLNRVKFGKETRCEFLYQQTVFYKSRFITTDNQNGWGY